MNDPAGLDIESFARQYLAQVERACPAALPLATWLWPRLDPAQWSLEWHLPVWLGEPFGLSRRLMSRIVLSNVRGLAAIRLRDDLADGELDTADVPAAERLSEALLAAALSPYRRLFPPGSEFWRRLDSWMAEWQAAMLDDRVAGAGTGWSAAELVRRAAPLKISAFATCLLAGRDDEFDRVAECLDHALTGMVLYDHLCDWQQDLGAGRPNAFVDACSASRPGPAARGASRTGVLAAMLSGQAIEPYSGRIHHELAAAGTIASRLGLTALAGYLGSLGREIDAQAIALGRRYRLLGDDAAGLLFGSHPAVALVAEGGSPA